MDTRSLQGTNDFPRIQPQLEGCKSRARGPPHICLITGGSIIATARIVYPEPPQGDWVVARYVDNDWFPQRGNTIVGPQGSILVARVNIEMSTAYVTSYRGTPFAAFKGKTLTAWDGSQSSRRNFRSWRCKSLFAYPIRIDPISACNTTLCCDFSRWGKP